MALFLAAFGVGLSVRGKNVKAVHSAANWAEGITVDNIRRALRTSREKGWIKQDLSVTRQGQKRLSTLIPLPRQYPKRWNNTWYLISFDIPRALNYKRDRLRDTLKRLGFGKLHDSLWISPQDFLGDVADFATVDKVGSYLIPAISKELGKERSRDLADRVWKLRELEMRYFRFINALTKPGEPPSSKLFIEYASILADDPFIPIPLLPEDWHGPAAHNLAQKHFSHMLKMLKQEGEELKQEYTEKDPHEALRNS